LNDLWREQAACKDEPTELFFPQRGEQIDEAREICRGCESLEPCRDYGLRHRDLLGVFGGLSERERQRIRGRKKRVTA